MNDVASEAAAPPALPPAAEPRSLAFTGARSEFRRLIMRGAFLELLTLGFYRFWLATDMRRHLWSNTSVNGDAMEYTGTAKELLIGFLFALAILVPIYLAYFFITFEAERLQAFASIPLALFFFFFYQFALYRARRYRLSRTVWRGVRFWMSGSGWAYALRAGLWTLLVIVSLGLALPWYQAVLERYKMRHSFYGDLPGRFEARGWDLFARYIWFWFGSVMALLATGGISAVAPFLSGLLIIAMLIAWPFVYAGYKAIEWRWWVSGIRFGDVRFASGLRAGELIPLYWMVIAWSAFIFIFLMVWWGVIFTVAWRLAGPGAMSNPEAIALVMQRIPMLVLLGLGYLIAALAFNVVTRMYLRRDVWVRVVASTAVFHLEAAADVKARGDAVGALGEGFADNLDIGGI